MLMNIIYNQKLAFLLKFFVLIWIIFIPMKTSFYQISFIMIVGIFCAYLFLNKKMLVFKDILQQNKNILLAFGLILLSMTISNSLGKFVTMDSWRTQFHYLFRYFFVFLILLFFHREKLISQRFIALAILCSLSLQGLDGLHQAIFGNDFIKGHSGSIVGGLSGATFNRNNFGFFMTIGASICTGLLFYKNDYKLTTLNTIMLTMLLFLFLFNLLFTYSRASWLFYNVFLFILVTLNYKKLSKKHYLAFGIVLISMICIFLYFDNLTLRLIQLLQMDDGGRKPIWDDALQLIEKNYLFGYGLMTYDYIASQPIFSIHNSILEILLFLGIFGFIAFTFLLYLILKEIVKAKNYFYLAFFFAFLVITQFDNSIIKGITSLSSLALFAFFIFSDKTKEV